MPRISSAVSLLALLAACQPAAPKVDAAAEEQAIRAQVAAFNAAVAAYDEAAIAALYAPDAALLPANMAKVTGTAGIAQFFGVLEPSKAVLVVTSTAIAVAAAGDVALEEGTWTYAFPTSDSTTAQDNGKYVVAWKKVNGTWLMQTDIWNSDNPPAPAPPATKGKA